MKGTVIDCAFIILGGLVGSLLKAKLIKGELVNNVMPSLGLCAILVGVVGCTNVNNPVVAVIALVVGGIVGNAIHLEDKVEKIFNKGSVLLHRMPVSHKFIEGIISYALLSVVGSMSIIGAMEDALTGDISLLLTKTVLDFVCAIFFSMTYGISICFSAVIVFLYQGIFSSLAIAISPILTPAVIGDMSAIGSVLIFIVGLNLLKVTDYKTMDLVPAIFLPILLWQFI